MSSYSYIYNYCKELLPHNIVIIFAISLIIFAMTFVSQVFESLAIYMLKQGILFDFPPRKMVSLYFQRAFDS
jgi:hypothetical protein